MRVMRFLTRGQIRERARTGGCDSVPFRLTKGSPNFLLIRPSQWRQPFGPLTTLGLLVGTTATLLSQPVSLPVEFRQVATQFNSQSQRGQPISTLTNVPPGSDGRMPTS